MPALAPLLLTTLLKATVILAMALALAAVLRRAPGLARHRLWSLAFAGLLLLPALVTALPPLPLPVPAPLARIGAALAPAAPAPGGESDSVPARSGREAESAGEDGYIDRIDERSTLAGDQTRRSASERFANDFAMASDRATADSGAISSSARSAGIGAYEWSGAGTSHTERGTTTLIGRHGPTTLLALWLAGVAAGVAFLLAGMVRAGWHARRGRPVDDEGWLHDLEWHRNFFGIRRRVRLLESERVRTPMTGGALRPMVLLPQGAATWSAERRRLVLLHELVHIRRWDVVRHWLARLGVALYWFHPLAWLAARSSSVAREQACDEEVLRLGVKPSVYARQLFELAQGLHPGRIPAAALPMIQRSQLERRLMAILDPEARPRAARASSVAAVLMVLTAVSAAMAVPQEQPVSPGATATAAQSSAVPSTQVTPVPMATPTPLASGEPSAPGPVATAAPQGSTCWPYGETRSWQRFSGTISTRDSDGMRRVDAVGTADGQRIVQQWIDDLRLCMRASGNVELDDDGSIGAIGDGGSLILEAELDGRLQSLTVRNDGGNEQLTWTVNGAARQVDQQTERWRAQMMTVLNEQARISTLRGQRSSLRGQISSIRGQRSSLRGQISSIRGQRSSLRGQISSIRGRQSSLNGEISSARGRVSSLRGQISSARGHVSSLRGQISTHRSAISGLQASRYGASEEELAVIEAAQRRHEEAIADIERQIEAYDLDGRVATIERQIEAFDLEGKIAEIESRRDTNLEAEIAEVERQIEELDVEGKVAEIERQIEELDVEGRVAEIEAQIEALHVDERVQQIEQRLEPALRELRDTIASIR